MVGQQVVTSAAEPDQIDGEIQEDEVEAEEQSEVDEVINLKEKEEALFGEALPHIMRLRKGVGAGSISPTQTAAGIFQAAEHFGSKAAEGEDLPLVFALFQEERFADLVDVLIPEAKPQFREEVSSAIYTGMANLKRQAGIE
jgi:hypothetical protein